MLRAFSPAALQAGLSSDYSALEKHLGATVPPDLFDDPAVLHYAAAALAADPDYLPWSVRAILLKPSLRMIGHIRFHSRPDPVYLHAFARDAVELGYVVFAAHRRQGYATEAAGGAMAWAAAQPGVKRFVATVSPANDASRRMVAKLGFRKVGEHLDEVDGVEEILIRDA